MRRNLLLIACFFCLGIVINRHCQFSVTVWLVLAGAAFLVNILFFFFRGKIQPAAFLLCVVLAGAFWYGLSRYPENLHCDMAGQTVEGEGIILTYPRAGEYNVTYTVDVRNLTCRDRSLAGVEKLLLKVKSSGELTCFPGDNVSFRGELSLPGGSRNPGEFNYREYLANRQTFYEVTCSRDDLRVLEEGKGIRALAARGRETVVRELDKILPPKEKGLLLGLLFGDTSGIPEEDWEGYRRAGVLHLFAVSGLHVAFVLGFVWFFLSFLCPAPLWRLLCGIPVLIGYYFLVGWTASIVRASLMAFLGLLALLLGRKQDIYTSLALAALVIVIISPGELFQAGFQLSFTAVAGIVYLTPHLEKRGLGKVFSVALAAQFATLPLSALYFNQVSLAAPFLNIIAVTLSGFVTVLALAGCLLVWSVPFLAEPLFLTGGSVMYLFSRVILRAAEPDWAALTVASPPLYIVVLYYALLLLMPFLPRWRPLLNRLPGKLKLTAGLLLLLGLVVSCWPQQSRMEVVFLDVGQGDSIFIKTPGGYTVLLDGGGTPGSSYAVGKKVVKPYLQRRGLDKIDIMIMSHHHLDHSEGLLEIIPDFSIGAFLLSPEGTDNEIQREIGRLCRGKNIPIRELTARQRIRLDDQVYLDVLHPAKGDKSMGNNHSLVLQVVYKEAKWLLTGDIEQEAIEDIMSHHFCLSSDVLKLPHHGSVSSYSPEFYEKVKPRAVVASVGFNLFNQPHPRVVEYFKGRKIPFYATRENGAVITQSDGSSVWIWTMLE